MNETTIEKLTTLVNKINDSFDVDINFILKDLSINKSHSKAQNKQVIRKTLIDMFDLYDDVVKTIPKRLFEKVLTLLYFNVFQIKVSSFISFQYFDSKLMNVLDIRKSRQTQIYNFDFSTHRHIRRRSFDNRTLNN